MLPGLARRGGGSGAKLGRQHLERAVEVAAGAAAAGSTSRPGVRMANLVITTRRCHCCPVAAQAADARLLNSRRMFLTGPVWWRPQRSSPAAGSAEQVSANAGGLSRRQDYGRSIDRSGQMKGRQPNWGSITQQSTVDSSTLTGRCPTGLTAYQPDPEGQTGADARPRMLHNAQWQALPAAAR